MAVVNEDQLGAAGVAAALQGVLERHDGPDGADAKGGGGDKEVSGKAEEEGENDGHEKGHEEDDKGAPEEDPAQVFAHQRPCLADERHGDEVEDATRDVAVLMDSVSKRTAEAMGRRGPRLICAAQLTMRMPKALDDYRGASGLGVVSAQDCGDMNEAMELGRDIRISEDGGGDRKTEI